MEPLLEYLEEMADAQPVDEVLTGGRAAVRAYTLVAESIAYANRGLGPRLALMFRRGVVITDVPYLESNEASKES